MSDNKASTVPSGSLAKASSVGAKTVKGPSPLRASTKPAACKAAAKVVKRPSATAVSTISAGGRMTLSMTWMMPFEASISVIITSAWLTNTLPSTTLIATGSSAAVSALLSVTTCSAFTAPGTTW